MFRLSTHVECLFKCARGYRWMPDKELGYCADDGGEPDNSLEPYVNLVEHDLIMDWIQHHLKIVIFLLLLLFFVWFFLFWFGFLFGDCGGGGGCGNFDWLLRRRIQKHWLLWIFGFFLLL